MFGLLDRYVTRICIGSFVICMCFIVGLFVVVDFLDNIDKYSRSIPKLPEEYRRLGFFLVGAYYLTFLPFIYMLVAPFITVTAGMFAVSRLMGANEVVPMLFCGRRLSRVLLPVFLMGLANALAMVGIRQFVLPQLVVQKDYLHTMIRHGEIDQSIEGRIIGLPGDHTLHLGRFMLRDARIENLHLRLKREDQRGEDSIQAKEARWVEDGARGPGWVLDGGFRKNRDADHALVLPFVPAAQIEGFDPQTIRNRIKETKHLLDLSYGELASLVREHPTVLEYSVGFHHNITFPLANLLLLLLALPFALRFERGSKIERVFFALLICGAYLVIDLSFQNLGRTGEISPVLAAWLPTLLFGSLGIVIFDGVRT